MLKIYDESEVSCKNVGEYNREKKL
jgi:hypothetical protein